MASGAAQLIDRFGRRITYLRISVTDRCDFRCVYCMADVMTFLPRQELLSLEEIDRLASAFVARGVRKLRLTGGEPLVRRNIMWLIEALSRHLGKGLDELTLTTNGSQLERYAEALADCGMVRHQRVARHARRRQVPHHHSHRRFQPGDAAASTRPTAPGSRSRSTLWRSAT